MRNVIICFVPSLRLIYWLIFDLPGELFATHGLHQEHEAPDTHRSEDGEEGDGEPEGACTIVQSRTRMSVAVILACLIVRKVFFVIFL